jgi:hypothetical protein
MFVPKLLFLPNIAARHHSASLSQRGSAGYPSLTMAITITAFEQSRCEWLGARDHMDVHRA